MSRVKLLPYYSFFYRMRKISTEITTKQIDNEVKLFISYREITVLEVYLLTLKALFRKLVTYSF